MILIFDYTTYNFLYIIKCNYFKKKLKPYSIQLIAFNLCAKPWLLDFDNLRPVLFRKIYT